MKIVSEPTVVYVDEDGTDMAVSISKYAETGRIFEIRSTRSNPSNGEILSDEVETRLASGGKVVMTRSFERSEIGSDSFVEARRRVYDPSSNLIRTVVARSRFLDGGRTSVPVSLESFVAFDDGSFVSKTVGFETDDENFGRLERTLVWMETTHPDGSRLVESDDASYEWDSNGNVVRKVSFEGKHDGSGLDDGTLVRTISLYERDSEGKLVRKVEKISSREKPDSFVVRIAEIERNEDGTVDRKDVELDSSDSDFDFDVSIFDDDDFAWDERDANFDDDGFDGEA